MTPTCTSAASTRRQSVREGRILSAHRSQPARHGPRLALRIVAVRWRRPAAGTDRRDHSGHRDRSDRRHRLRRPTVGRFRRSRIRSPTAGARPRQLVVLLAKRPSSAPNHGRHLRGTRRDHPAWRQVVVDLGVAGPVPGIGIAIGVLDAGSLGPGGVVPQQCDTRWTKRRPRSSTAMPSST